MVPRAARKGKYPELRVFTDYDLRSSAREALGSGRARAARSLRRTEKSEPRKRTRARSASFKIGSEPRKKCPRTFRRVRGHNRSKFPVSSRNVRARGSSGRAEHPRRRTEVSDGRPVRIEEENRLPTKRRTCLKLPIYGVNATVFRRRKYSHTFLSLGKPPHDFDIFP